MVLCTIVTLSCKKNKPDPIVFPEETQEGKNTFGCYVNDKPFIASTTLLGLVKPLSVNYFRDSTPNYPAGFLSVSGIDARYSSDHAGDVVINTLRVFSTGEYNLVHTINCNGIYPCDGIVYRNASANKNYFATSGKLSITRLDTLNKIVSGRFYFTAKDAAGISVTITDGRFDAEYSN